MISPNRRKSSADLGVGDRSADVQMPREPLETQEQQTQHMAA